VKLIKEKRKVYREFIQSRDPLLKTLFNKLNAQIRRDINIYREETWIKTCESLDYRDGKKFWNKFKVITGQKRKTNHYLATDAHIYYTPQERANCFAELLDGIHQGPNDPNFNATFSIKSPTTFTPSKTSHSSTLFLTPWTTNTLQTT
jgi:hypothetical protein